MLVWVLVALGAALVMAIGFFAIGRETAVLGYQARPAVFDLEEAVDFIAERLPEATASRISVDDVRWILRVDASTLEEATVDADDPDADTAIVAEDSAIARILAKADKDDRAIDDEDIVAVINARTTYLEAIGAIGPEVTD